MSSIPQPSIPDAAARELARVERARNVLVDAGAGTGKTTLIVRRLVELVAPEAGGDALDLDRIAAVTFTRRAAGELRLRIREELLRALSAPAIEATRKGRLYAALGKLDTAWVGTIHGFADRLLRHYPMEANVSPAYAIAEDSDALVRETWSLLQLGVETGTLASLLPAGPAAARAAEAEQTILEALRAGLRAETLEEEYTTRYGIDALVAGFIRHRDRPPPEPELAAFDPVSFQVYADELEALVRPLTGQSSGTRALRELAALASRLRSETDAAVVLASLAPELETLEPSTKAADFDGDSDAWRVKRMLFDDEAKKPPRVPPLRDDLLASATRCLAARLVRLFPVAVALYEKVKARHGAVDEIDLLLQLRDLLAKHEDVRAACQARFDHIFVDEFQDTDPLQAEVLVYLCQTTSAGSAPTIAPGKLTVVGDPKQSIYRFRRADIAMYEQVRGRLLADGALAVSLSANFRSTAPMIDWFNDRFPHILGAPGSDGRSIFDAEAGTVSHEPLRAGRSANAPTTPVHIVALTPDPEATKVAQRRALEAEAVARYLRHLIERGDVQVRDPVTEQMRPLHPGDIAVLALETTNLGLLFPELDRAGIPYGARGGKLFLDEQLHRQFLLGLRALAGDDDGIAEAALLRPPFFAVDLLDLVAQRPGGTNEGTDGAAGARAQAARDQVRELRRRRFQRPPGATARDLLEQTAFGRSVALGPNGGQRLERLRELCLVLEQTATERGLDFDGVTALMRDWVTTPVALDPPHPVGADVVQILTVHQAKGLEFPVVVLWDSCADFRGRSAHRPWQMASDGEGWQIRVDKFGWAEPQGMDLVDQEKKYLEAERRRVVYVAATRARDLLILPVAVGLAAGKSIHSTLGDGGDAATTHRAAPYVAGAGAPWAGTSAAAREVALQVDERLADDVGARWLAAGGASMRPRFLPTAVTAAVRAEGVRAEREAAAALLVADADVAEAGADAAGPATPVKRRRGRYGAAFGTVVHEAIELALKGVEVSDAVRLAAMANGAEEHLAEAKQDVGRALAALRAEGLDGSAGGVVRVEYPVAGVRDGQMLIGFIDLVHAGDGTLTVVDFKTDVPPTGGRLEETHAAYVAQARAYGALLDAAGLCAGRVLRCGLLFTADGGMRWVSVWGGHAGDCGL